jgi:hypothetical protein
LAPDTQVLQVQHVPDLAGQLVADVDVFKADDAKEGGMLEQLAELFLEYL